MKNVPKPEKCHDKDRGTIHRRLQSSFRWYRIWIVLHLQLLIATTKYQYILSMAVFK